MADDVCEVACSRRTALSRRHGLEQARAGLSEQAAPVVGEDERDRGAPGIDSQRSIRSAGWGDRSGNGRMTVRRCNKPSGCNGASAEIFAESWVTIYSVLTGRLLCTLLSGCM